MLAITGPLPLADFVPLFPVSAFSPSSSSSTSVVNPDDTQENEALLLHEPEPHAAVEPTENMIVDVDNPVVLVAEPAMAQAAQLPNNQGFRCPFTDCKGSTKNWLAVSSLVHHLYAHVRAGRVPPLRISYSPLEKKKLRHMPGASS